MRKSGELTKFTRSGKGEMKEMKNGKWLETDEKKNVFKVKNKKKWEADEKFKIGENWVNFSFQINEELNVFYSMS